MTNLHVFTYNDYEITFDFSKEHKMINLSQMAKVFDKFPKDFFKLKSTKEYVKALLTHLNNPVRTILLTEKDLIYTVQGGTPELQGTWVHKLVAIRAAQWLDPFFAIWVDEKVEELLVEGFTTLEAATDFRVIYFIKAKELNRVKIGMTTNLTRRMTAFKIASPVELELLKIMRANEVYQSDADIHDLFPHLRVHGEWFHLTQELQHFIDNLTTQLPILKEHKVALYTQNLQQLEEKITLLQQHLDRKDELIESLTKEVGRLQKECMQLVKRQEKAKRIAMNHKITTRSSDSALSSSPTATSISNNGNDFFYYKDRHLFHKLAYRDIVYLEAAGDHTTAFTQDGNQHSIPHHIQMIEERFPPKVFVRTHQHYILSLLHITTIDSRERMVYLHPKFQWKVPIARRQHTAFLKHIKKLQEPK